jgi:hypothetical protein
MLYQDRHTIYYDTVGVMGYLFAEGTMNTIVFYQMGQGRGICKVIDDCYLYGRMSVQKAKEGPANTSESVNAYIDMFHMKKNPVSPL